MNLAKKNQNLSKNGHNKNNHNYNPFSTESYKFNESSQPVISAPTSSSSSYSKGNAYVPPSLEIGQSNCVTANILTDFKRANGINNANNGVVKFDIEQSQAQTNILDSGQNNQLSNKSKLKVLTSNAYLQASHTIAATSTVVGGVINRHFAADSAVRDFNETMPVVVLPSNFKPTKGVVISSDPNKRLNETNGL